ncbi:hypothetical protein MXC99_07905, partial [Thauera aromatica]|uniref:hypothetical protein n=1 Tax=Thauera aromatica TaxID=59405 RepID=UPI001FFC383A
LNSAVYSCFGMRFTSFFLSLRRSYDDYVGRRNSWGSSPTLAQRGETLWTWAKSSLADTTPRLWALIGDGRFFYFLPLYRTDASNTGAVLHYFGDIASLVPNDKYGCVIVAHESAAPSSSSVTDKHPGGFMGLSTGYSRYVARGGAQTGAATTFLLSAGFTTNTYIGTYNASEQPYPDGNLRFGGPVAVLDGISTTSPFRGHLPGIVLPLGRIVPTSFTALFESAAAALFGVKAVQVSNTLGTIDSYVCHTLFDIRGPWR